MRTRGVRRRMKIGSHNWTRVGYRYEAICLLAVRIHDFHRLMALHCALAQQRDPAHVTSRSPTYSLRTAFIPYPHLPSSVGMILTLALFCFLVLCHD